MTTLQLHETLPRIGTYQVGHERRRLMDRLEAFFSAEAAKGNVALRLMLLGTAVSAFFAVYMLAGPSTGARCCPPLVLAHLMVGGVFIVTTIGIDSFARHTSWMWVLEEEVELLGLAGSSAPSPSASTRHGDRPWR